ncbi:hypothetical protein LTR34_006069 [Exophiala xenobiotica]|nr:hypothetical protein LTR34_006069 [Exophiala xenobiotica]
MFSEATSGSTLICSPASAQLPSGLTKALTVVQSMRFRGKGNDFNHGIIPEWPRPHPPQDTVPHTPLSFTLRYLETLELRSDPLVWSMNSHDNFGRELRWDKLDRKDLVFYVRRNASFWTRKTDHGWDTIIFTEPPVKVGDPSAPYQPYQHGYYDVAPWPESHQQGQTQNRTARGPFRKSMLDDLKFYWTQRATQRERESAINDPRMCAHYMKRIAIAQWNIALEYLWKKVCWCSRGVWKFEESWPEGGPVGMVDGKTLRLEGKELYDFLRTQTARSSEWRRKVGFLIDWLQTSLESLGISRLASTTPLETDPLLRDDDPLSDYNTDFLLVLEKLKDYRAELESTLSAITGVSQMIQGGVSLDETSRATKLSVVGLVFIPFAYVSSLLSMAGDFQPGKRQFWIYFAVAIPLCVLMVLGWRLIDGSIPIGHYWSHRWLSLGYWRDRLPPSMRGMSKSKSKSKSKSTA